MEQWFRSGCITFVQNENVWFSKPLPGVMHKTGTAEQGDPGGGRAPPQYFQIFKELVWKRVLCHPSPIIESLKCPPLPISKMLCDPWKNP